MMCVNVVENFEVLETIYISILDPWTGAEREHRRHRSYIHGPAGMAWIK